MDDQQIGTTLRSIRIRQGKTQLDVAVIAHVSRFVVGRIEQGRLASIPLGKLRAVATALDDRLDLVARWRGGDLGRLINARHSAMHDSAARMFGLMAGWDMEPEVSFSIYGERGVIDILAWHPARRCLLVIELKTELVDLNDLMGSVDRKRRLAGDIARDRGWHPASISTWVAIADGRTNRRAVTAHSATLRAKFPIEGAGVRRWLREPYGRIDGLGFLPYVRGTLTRQDLGPTPGSTTVQTVKSCSTPCDRRQRRTRSRCGSCLRCRACT